MPAPKTAELHDIQPLLPQSQSDLMDAARLRAIADLADSKGAARFTPGGGVRFDKPLSREESRALPETAQNSPRLLNLPQDRFHRAYASDASFANRVDTFTVPHVHAGYRLVVIPLTQALSAGQLRVIAETADAFGHGTIRLTADVSIRLPNVPNALLRPLFSALESAGLLTNGKAKLAA